jgi:hypothetical protein
MYPLNAVGDTLTHGDIARNRHCCATALVYGVDNGTGRRFIQVKNSDLRACLCNAHGDRRT